MAIDAPLYPVQLVVAGRPCLVVGGGPVALRKATDLVACGAVVTVVAPDVDPRLRTLDLTVVPRAYETTDVEGMRLVITATGDPLVDHRVAADADDRGIWVNSADDPDVCSFTLPAVVRRGPVTVAVATGGRSPAMARWLRDKLEHEVGAEYEVLVGMLSTEREARRVRGEQASAAAWRRALDDGLLDLIRSGELDQARERLQTCLSSSSA